MSSLLYITSAPSPLRNPVPILTVCVTVLITFVCGRLDGNRINVNNACKMNYEIVLSPNGLDAAAAAHRPLTVRYTVPSHKDRRDFILVIRRRSGGRRGFWCLRALSANLAQLRNLEFSPGHGVDDI